MKLQTTLCQPRFLEPRLALVAAGFAAECVYLLDPRLGWLGPLWSPQRAWWTSVGHLWLWGAVVPCDEW